jgi:hypothetical protein
MSTRGSAFFWSGVSSQHFFPFRPMRGFDSFSFYPILYPFNRLRHIRHPEADGLAHFEVGDEAGDQDEFGENHRFCIFRRDTLPLWFGKFAAPWQNSPRVNQSGE